jgi:hypothetical protein
MERGLWKEIGRTEIVKNSKNPTFVKKLSVYFKFEGMSTFQVFYSSQNNKI